MVSSWDNQVRQVQTTLQGFFGELAQVYAVGTTTNPKTLTVIQSQVQAQNISIDSDGEASVREIALQVAISDWPTPARGDVYILSSPGNAGAWQAHKVEKFNNLRNLITARWTRHQFAGDGAVRVQS